MKTLALNLGVFAVMSFVLSTSFAQEPLARDAGGCTDPPFFTRPDHYYITKCSSNRNAYDFKISESQSLTVEGGLISTTYSFDSHSRSAVPGSVQVVNKYKATVEAMGGTRISSANTNSGNNNNVTFRFQKDGNEYYLGISGIGNNPLYQFTVALVTRESLNSEAAANVMTEKINEGETLTPNINFETGTSAIKDESQDIVVELYKMMNENPTLEISVEGHTDNVGSKIANQTLSEGRAESIKAALVMKGISADRIKTSGFGQDQPLGDNTTEDGKAKNRRVEIKKL